jgi:hypothetical protein
MENKKYRKHRISGKVKSDINKHAFLDIPDEGRIYEVLSVGFHHRSNNPIITVKLGDLVQVYRLPEDYINWVNELSRLSLLGAQPLPATVEFGKDLEEYLAQML